jgi:uncharacterized FAD-dependent dehydrogenase
MKNNTLFDVIIIGSGPSGILTSIKLVEAGLSVALVDNGGNYYTRLHTKTTRDLTGFGGAAMRYDANLDYSDGIPPKSNLGKRVFGNNEVATKCIKDVYNKLNFFGLEIEIRSGKKVSRNSYHSGLKIVDRGILPIGEKASIRILRNIYNYLVSNNTVFFEFTEVIRVTKRDGFEVKALRAGKEMLMLFGKKVVFATGKLSLSHSRAIFDQLGVKYEYCDSLDVGVRIETKKKSTDPITIRWTNPKIIFEDQGVTSRTFCWCPGGKVIYYKFEGMSIVDGQHCHDNPTNQTNFGIVTSINLPRGVDGTKLGISYITTFNEFTKYRPGLQLMRDFINKRVSSEKEINSNEIAPTISEYCLVDLNMLLIFGLSKSILNLVQKINEKYPGTINNNSLIYGPVLEKIFPKVNLDTNMESSIKGFYLVGDISGKAIGVVTGAAMGIKAAQHIIQSINT